jgi:hypothetical protein
MRFYYNKFINNVAVEGTSSEKIALQQARAKSNSDDVLQLADRYDNMEGEFVDSQPGIQN